MCLYFEGPAVLYGSNNDKLDFSYKNGKKIGAMTYSFHDGCVERGFFDDFGLLNGPTQFTWPNGAKREGHKVNITLSLNLSGYFY